MPAAVADVARAGGEALAGEVRRADQHVLALEKVQRAVVRNDDGAARVEPPLHVRPRRRRGVDGRGRACTHAWLPIERRCRRNDRAEDRQRPEKHRASSLRTRSSIAILSSPPPSSPAGSLSSRRRGAAFTSCGSRASAPRHWRLRSGSGKDGRGEEREPRRSNSLIGAHGAPLERLWLQRVYARRMRLRRMPYMRVRTTRF